MLPRLVPCALLLALFILLNGCATPPPNVQSRPSPPATATDAPLSNLYTVETLTDDIRRVVVLPVHYDAFQEDIHDYLDELWAQAVQRQNRFEVVVLDRETIADWSGQSQWSSTIALPAKLHNQIERIYQPDAVLLCDLTRLESYQPLEIGLRAKLFRWDDGAFIWGVDGVWTQQPGGSVHAEPSALEKIFKFSRKNPQNNLDLSTISPRYFYYHLVESVALTLPKRK